MNSTAMPNHALLRILPSRRGCNRGVPWAGSMSLGREAAKCLPAMPMLKPVLLILCMMMLVSCGGGTWEDDAGNWSRAFNGQTLPENVVVTHSKYVRSPHFTYEADYYFELKAPKEFFDAWCAGCVAERPSESNLGSMPGKPNWFLPKPLEKYEMWKDDAKPDSDFRLFRDKETGVIFAKDSET